MDDRLKWFLGNRPVAAGRCAEHTMNAIGLQPQGLPDATAVARRVQRDGHMRTGAVPRGAIRYWDGGSEGHGHVALEYAELNDPSLVASTDVAGPRTVGTKVFSWFERTWPKLNYLGWSWYFGSIDTEEKAVTPPAYSNIKVETDQVIKFNEWVTLDLGADDEILPPVGSNDWWVQVHLSLATATVPRNDVRYVKGRWARHVGSEHDTHGTDTKAVSADIPKDSWQGSFSTDMRGLVGVPVSFQVYIGAMKPGTIVSPMRLFTIDDETT